MLWRCTSERLTAAHQDARADDVHCVCLAEDAYSAYSNTTKLASHFLTAEPLTWPSLAQNEGVSPSRVNHQGQREMARSSTKFKNDQRHTLSSCSDEDVPVRRKRDERERLVDSG